MTPPNGAKTEVKLKSFFPDAVKTHREETLELSEKELRLLRKIHYYNLSCGIIFPQSPLLSRRLKALSELIARSGTPSEQEFLYCNVPDEHVANIEKFAAGDGLTITGVRFLSGDPNQSRNGVHPQHPAVFRIKTDKNLRVLAVPSYIFSGDVYLLPENSSFVITRVETQTWICCPRLSCPTKHEGVRLITLEAKGG